MLNMSEQSALQWH